MSDKSRLERIEAMLADSPDDVELHYMLAMEYSSAGADEKAVARFEDMMQSFPEYAPAYHMAGRALVRLDRTDRAKEVLRAGIAAARQQGDDHAAGEMTELLDSLAGS